AGVPAPLRLRLHPGLPRRPAGGRRHRGEGLPLGPLAALFLEAPLDALDVEFDAEHVRIDFQRLAVPGERLVVALELRVDESQARERAEMARVALQHFA